MNGALPVTVAALLAVGVVFAAVPLGAAAEAIGKERPIVLYFQGDGSDTVGVPSVGPETTWPLTLDKQHGTGDPIHSSSRGNHSRFVRVGPATPYADNEPGVPTFENRDVVLGWGAEVTVNVSVGGYPVEHPACRFAAVFFHAAGRVLGDATTPWSDAASSGEIEVRFTVNKTTLSEDAAASVPVEGLRVQVGTASPECAASRATVFVWGSERAPSRVELQGNASAPWVEDDPHATPAQGGEDQDPEEGRDGQGPAEGNDAPARLPAASAVQVVAAIVTGWAVLWWRRNP